jgi:hypothetical protein
MQINARFVLQTTALLLAGLLLAAALGRTPLILFDERTLLYALAGLSPLPFLRGDLVARYFGPSTTLAGVGGILVLFRDRLECMVGNAACVHHDSHQALVAAGFYVILAVAGLFIIKRIPKNAKSSSKPVR